MRTESVKCPAHAVSQARAYYVTQFTYKSEKPTDLNYSISRVSYVHSSRTTLFRSSFRKPKRFRSLCRLRIPVYIVFKKWNR